MKRETASDESFLLDEEAPKVKACLMHPYIEALYTYTLPLKNDEMFGGVLYGLCAKCWKRIQMEDVEFIIEVGKEIEDRLQVLANQKEKKDV